MQCAHSHRIQTIHKHAPIHMNPEIQPAVTAAPVLIVMVCIYITTYDTSLTQP